MCKKIHRGGNAEQYNADKKYKEAVAVAVEACADDTMEIECAGWRAGARLHARENPNDDGGYVISIPLSRIDRA